MSSPSQASEQRTRPDPGPAGGEAELLTTGEVMRRTGLSRQVLYQYTAIGLIREAAVNEAGHRLYPPRVVRHLELIRALNQTGYSLRDIKDIFFSGE